MKIILSPSKTQNLTRPLKSRGKKLFKEEKSKYLFTILRKMDKREIGELFKIKGKLLEETYILYQGALKDRFEPIGCYDGVVYDKLCKRKYDAGKRKYLEKHLTILSAMFGVIEPGMGMWPYRLDFKIKPQGINLYEYWKTDILEYFKSEDIIINLASKEFSSILKPIAKKLINIHFLEEDGRVLSFKAKKARGLMADAIVELMLENPEELKEIQIEGYKYCKNTSDDKNYYYIRGDD